jgi:hypothetical protein
MQCQMIYAHHQIVYIKYIPIRLVCILILDYAYSCKSTLTVLYVRVQLISIPMKSFHNQNIYK